MAAELNISLDKEGVEKLSEEAKKFAMLKQLNVDTEDIIQRIGAMQSNPELAENEKFVSLMETMNLLKNPDGVLPTSAKTSGVEGTEQEAEETDSYDVEEVSDEEAESYPQSDESVTLSQG